MMSVGGEVGRAWWYRLGPAALPAVAAAQAYAFAISPPDQGMGHLQKIMYVHVPTVQSAFVAFAIVFICSVLYLLRGRETYDLLAASAAEAGVLLTALTLALGSIWARPTWGVWWTWDPRLTTTAILLVIWAGYLALRSFTEDEQQRARWSAGVGILGFLVVPLVYMSVRWWRTIHQLQSSADTMDAAYLLGLRLNSLVFLTVLAFFISWRYRAAKLERQAEARLEAAALEGVGKHV